MSLLELVLENEPRLYEESVDYVIDETTAEIVDLMVKTMKAHKGIGLAGPQVGINERIFVMIGLDFKPIIVINPKWAPVAGANKILGPEGCLSFPGLFLNVKRYDSIITQYTDADGQMFEEEFEGVRARIFQHEYEHLDGITFDKKVTKPKLDLARRKMKKRQE